MSPRHDVTVSEKIRVLHLLAVDDYTIKDAANEAGVSYEQAADIAKHHGYPEPGRMLWAIDRLQAIADGSPVVMATPHPPIEEEQASERPAVTPQQRTGSDDLLHRASKSDRARTRNLAEKVKALLTDLSERLDAETQEREAEAAERAQKAAAEKRIKELQAEIQRLRSSTGARVVAEPAVTGGATCPDCGRVCANGTGLSAHRRNAHREAVAS